MRRVTPGQGDLPSSSGQGWVRVKWCGKSAPRSLGGVRQAKPRTEQDQIERRHRAARPKPPGRSLDLASDGEARGMVVAWARTFGAEPDTEFGLSSLCGGPFEKGSLVRRSSIEGCASHTCVNGGRGESHGTVREGRSCGNGGRIALWGRG